ncbi:MAG: aminotransferase class IV family protein [Acidobacteria bacterium]|nr:aminotransferase class IV family protein [Acidobacteriota bacterium]
MPFEFERHWARMTRDAALLHVPLSRDREQVRGRIGELIRANRAENAVARMCVVRNRDGFWEGPGIASAADLIVLTADLKKWGGAVRLTAVRQARHAASPFAGTKILSWAYNLTWVEEAQQRGFDEVVLLNERDEVAECTSANIFAVVDGAICTPPLSSGCLPGVTRNVLLEEVGGIEQRTLRLEDLCRAEEVFLTSATRELLAVEEIDGRPILTGGGHGHGCSRHLRNTYGAMSGASSNRF